MLQLILVALLAASAAFGQVPVAGPSLSGGANANGTIVANVGLFGGATSDGTSKLLISGALTINGTNNVNSLNLKNSALTTIIDALSGGDGDGLLRIYGSAGGSAKVYLYSNGASYFNGGNLLVGGTTDGNYKLDVQSSGTTGTLRVYDQGGAGSTLAVIQAGGAQSGSLFSLRTNAGVETLYATSAGELGQKQATVDKWYLNYPNFDFASAGAFRWSSTTNAFGTVDSGLARNAAGVIEANSGSAGTLRDFLARQYRNTPVAVASLQTCNAGNKGSVASVNDATAPAWGVTVANGGAAYALVTCNGTNWTVTGI
jgi:hypothetical protein